MWFGSKYPCKIGDVDDMSTSPSNNLDDSQDEETEVESQRLEKAFYARFWGKSRVGKNLSLVRSS